MNLNRIDGETDFEWKLRLCLAKKNKELDADWIEIRDVLGIDLSPDQLRKVAVGYQEYHDYINGFDGALTSILSISDLHVPFQLPKDKLSAYVGNIDVLQINGDILDCAGISKFPKFYRSNPVEEMIVGRQYLIDIINYIKPKKIVANYGNHEIRLGNYLAKNLDNELQELIPMTALDYIFDDGFKHYDRKTGTKTWYAPIRELFPDIEIDYTGKWYSVIGDAVFAHPKTFSSAPLKTAEKSLYWFRNEGFEFTQMIMAHTHRVGQYKIGNSNIIEQGAFCDTEKMEYNDGLLINSQKQGFVVLYQNKDGKTIESKTRLVALN